MSLIDGVIDGITKKSNFHKKNHCQKNIVSVTFWTRKLYENEIKTKGICHVGVDHFRPYGSFDMGRYSTTDTIPLCLNFIKESLLICWIFMPLWQTKKSLVDHKLKSRKNPLLFFQKQRKNDAEKTMIISKKLFEALKNRRSLRF